MVSVRYVKETPTIGLQMTLFWWMSLRGTKEGGTTAL